MRRRQSRRLINFYFFFGPVPGQAYAKRRNRTKSPSNHKELPVLRGYFSGIILMRTTNIQRIAQGYIQDAV